MAFDGEKKTETASHKGQEDKNPPDWKRLNPQAIATTQALAGIAACADGRFVHGDLRELIQANRQTDILQNDTLAIQGDQAETIEKTSTSTIKLGRSVMVGVYDDLEVSGDRKVWVNGHDLEHYLTRREIFEPNEKFEYKHFCVEYGLTNIETLATAFETKAFQMALESVKVEAKLFEETNALIAGKIDAITAKAECMDVSLGLLLLRINLR